MTVPRYFNDWAAIFDGDNLPDRMIVALFHACAYFYRAAKLINGHIKFLAVSIVPV